MSQNCDHPASLVQHFCEGRLSAKDIRFPDRFFSRRAHENMNEDCYFEDTLLYARAKDHNKCKNGAVTDSEAQVNCLPSSQINEEGYREWNSLSNEEKKEYIRRYEHDEVRNTFQKRIAARKALEKRCNYPMCSEGNISGFKDKPWQVISGEETKERQRRNAERDLAHEMWMESHEAYIHRCATHREKCVERLCKRRFDNYHQKEKYCDLGHRPIPSCSHARRHISEPLS